MSISKIDKEFVKVFAQTPDVLAAAPGRVNLIGEHIDYSDGYVLPFAIADRTYAAIRKRPDRVVRIASTQASRNVPSLIPRNNSSTSSGNSNGYEPDRLIFGGKVVPKKASIPDFFAYSDQHRR